MKRRAFIAALGGAAVWPLVARAQGAMRRVGYVWIGARGTDVSIAGLRQGFVDKGYVIGRDLALEERYADGHAEHVPALIAELLALSVDVLVTPGTPITRAAKRATSTVPIVCVTGDPVSLGLVASLSRPGGNVTGLSLLSNDYSAKWLELLKEAVPKLDRIAVLWNPIDDDFQPKPPQMLQRGVDFATEALDQEQTKLFIHCAAGVHRAPMMTLAVLCSMGWTQEAAMDLIEKRRPVVDFAEVYVRSVERFLGQQVRVGE